MRKVVINTCFGGFGLSQRAKEELGLNESCSEYDVKRDNPELVHVVEQLGDLANGDHAQLKVIEIPEDVDWVIEEYDGQEWVAEKHRTWR